VEYSVKFAVGVTITPTDNHYKTQNMQIQIKVKQAGRRRLIVENQRITIEDIGSKPTLRQLITAIVTQQVDAYNAKTLERPILDFLTETQIGYAAHAGKVGFGSIYHAKKADLPQAIQNAIHAHVDGLFLVAVDQHVVADLDTTVHLSESSVLTFIKLTLLHKH
jgi:hypothetical protein